MKKQLLFFFEDFTFGGAWLAQLIKHPTLRADSVPYLSVMELRPKSGSVLSSESV